MAKKKTTKKKSAKKTAPAAPEKPEPYMRGDGVRFDRADLQQAYDGSFWHVTMKAGGAYVDKSKTKVAGVSEAPK